MNLLFKQLAGSHSYGLATENSDMDFKGVFLDTSENVLLGQITSEHRPNKDEVYYEVSKFTDLLLKGNPNILEMILVDDEFVKQTSSFMDALRDIKKDFITKSAVRGFVNFALNQIRKSSGTDKLMNWEKRHEQRATIFDFMYVINKGKKIAFRVSEFSDRPNLGVSRVSPTFFALYEHPSLTGLGDENSNDIRVSSIPEDAHYLSHFYFNVSDYSDHCMKYRQYLAWLENRNADRYIESQTHGQMVDGKNVMHAIRLLELASGLLRGELSIKARRNLLDVKAGKFDLANLVEASTITATNLLEKITESSLPDEVDPEVIRFVKLLVLDLRVKATRNEFK